MDFPQFTYHSKPVQSGVFEKYSGQCSCCGNRKGWRYIGPFYCITDVENICPWCIKSGEAAEKFDMTFVDDYGPERLNSESKIRELTKQTPGYFSAQEDRWPTHCHDYCKLIGYAKWSDIKPLLNDIQEDLNLIMNQNDLSRETLVYELSREHSPLWAYLFECNHCNAPRLVADYE